MSAYDAGNNIRTSRAQKKINYDLLNGIINSADVEDTMNPLGLKSSYVSTSLQDYSKIKSKVDLLVGESIKRPFEFEVRSINPTAVSEREEEINQMVNAQLIGLIDPTQNPKFDEAMVEKKLRKLQRFAKYEYKEKRERMSNHLLKYLFKRLDLDLIFMRGMEDMLAVSEEIFAVDIRSNNLIFEKLSPLNVQFLRMGTSPNVEDADITIIDSYHPVGYVIDNFHEYLTETDVKTIESYFIRREGDGALKDGGKPAIWYPQEINSNEQGFEGLYFDNSGTSDGEYFDSDGNIRVIRVIWRSLRKVGKLKYYDEEGVELFKWVDENWKADPLKGEEITWTWVTEFWQGYRLAKDIFVKLEPLPRVGSNIDNPSKCISPIVGTMINIDQQKQRSLVDLLKPWEYMHAEIMHRMRKAINRFRMPSADVDVAAIPDWLEIEDWIYYDQEVGYRFRDSFKESDKGSSQGKIVGGYQNMEKLFNPDMRNYIEQHLAMLNYIDAEMGNISGITKQREGQIEQRELVGNVEVARTQSSHITEKLFMLHESTKLRALTTLLEFAKYYYRGKNNIKLTYVTDDLSTATINLDGDLLAEAEYGLFVSNSRNDYKLRNSLESMSQQMFNAQMIGLKDVVDILHSPSIVEMKKSLEDSEERRMEQAQQNNKEQNEIAKQQIAQAAAEKQADRDLTERNNIRDNERALVVASMGNNETEDTSALDEFEKKMKSDKQRLDESIARAKETLEKSKLNETIRHNKETEKIAKSKPKPQPAKKS